MFLPKLCSHFSYCVVNTISKQKKSFMFTQQIHRYGTFMMTNQFSTQASQASTAKTTMHFITKRSFHESYTRFKMLERPPGKIRRNRRKLDSESGVKLQVTAYQTSKEDFDFELLERNLESQNLYKVSELPPDMEDVLHCTPIYPVEEHQKEIFFTKQGSVVFWDVPERERWEVLHFVKDLDPENAFDDKFIDDESESMMVTLSDKETSILDSNTINMNKEVYSQHQGQLEKFTCSNALMQSLHLSAMEKLLEDFIDDTEHLSMDLKAGRRIRIKHREVQQHLGKLFEFRKNLNLCSDLLDTPDFYWDRDDLEKLYLEICRLMQTKYRTKVMNEKLTYCIELMELLNNKFTDTRHTNLEWMIIVLIMIEVLFEVLHLYRNDYDWFVGRTDSEKTDEK